jgi:hypothetical protein
MNAKIAISKLQQKANEAMKGFKSLTPNERQ